MMIKVMLSIFILGLSFGAGPCLASCGPMLLSYIAGTKKDIPKSLFAYLLFSLSRIFVYLVLGAAVFFLGRLIFERTINLFRIILLCSGVFIMLLAVLMFLGDKSNFISCSKLHRFFIQKDKKSIIMLGLIAGVFPCSPLIAMLVYAGLISRNIFDNLLYVLSFGLGTSISVLIIFVGLIGVIPNLLNNLQTRYVRLFNLFCAIVMFLLGIQMIRRSL